MDIMNNVELTEEVLEEVAGGKSTKASYYVIQKGDTLTKIANRFGTTVKKLCELNAIENPDLIVAGKKIRIK